MRPALATMIPGGPGLSLKTTASTTCSECPCRAVTTCKTRRCAAVGVAFYETEFFSPRSWEGQRILLHFGSAHYHADVWLNSSRPSPTMAAIFISGGRDVAACRRWRRQPADGCR